MNSSCGGGLLFCIQFFFLFVFYYKFAAFNSLMFHSVHLLISLSIFNF